MVASKMVNLPVDYESPLKMALSVAKEATPDSSGREIVSFLFGFL